MKACLGLYKPSTIPMLIEGMLKTIYGGATDNIFRQAIPMIHNAIRKEVFPAI